MNRSSRLREWAVCGGDYDGLALAVLAQAVRDIATRSPRSIIYRNARYWLCTPSAQNLCYWATGANLLEFLENLAQAYYEDKRQQAAKRVQRLCISIAAKYQTKENS